MRKLQRELDPTRAVAAASDRPEKARLNAIPEALGFNRYPYWYDDRNSMRMLIERLKNAYQSFRESSPRLIPGALT